MPFKTPIGNLIDMLAQKVKANEFFMELRGAPIFEDITDPGQRDIELVFQMYANMMGYVKDQTFFSVLAGRLIGICVEHFEDRMRVLTALRNRFGPRPALTSETLSFYIMFSFVAGEYDDLTILFRRYLDERAKRGMLDGPLLIAMRSFLTASSQLWSLSDHGPIPAEARQALQRKPPGRRAPDLAEMVDSLIRERCTALRGTTPTLHLLFAMDDFVIDRLNTLTKLYCDYFYVLAKYTQVRITVRVYRITLGYDHARMPAIWDPPDGELGDLMKVHFGNEGNALAEKIDFRYVNCWEETEDYVGTIARDIDVLRPDVYVTCLERQASFLETVLYELSPLLQIEVVNGSGFIRHCDVLVPNGSVSEQRQREFHCVLAPLPQTSFPIIAPVTKTELGFAEDSYVVAVVAKEFPRRLISENKAELSKAFAVALVELQVAYPALSLLLIGETPDGIDAWFSRAGVQPDRARLRVIDFAQDLRATMQACDLVVNPPQKGGARGMGLAITDQLPVLVFSDTDATNFVPTSNVCADIAAFVAKAGYYVRKGCGYREAYVSVSGDAPFSDAYNRQCAIAFVEAAWIAAARGRARLAQKSLC